ncbi:acyltransferase [Flavobacterium quisquiliarum]|uniref:Acyltransferase n=1 Tax=Flavobacterium quisquiliarum TaxID=1834436 RepID=A0ABV8W3D8_9FLAO|nr:acyltransferase [Flavobacterium quisquiliarum]
MIVLKILAVLMPWPIKRFILIQFFKYKIDPSARIGLSWIYPKKLIMDANSNIGNFNVAVHLDLMKIGKHSSIARGNWITGFPTNTDSKHFAHQKDRHSNLIIGEHSAITKNHHIDCTNIIQIGNFVTVAGYASQLLTHSINIELNIQDSHPITIGDYCFVGTASTILGGASLPPYCVLGANSLLNKSFTVPYRLYGGNPAKEIKELSQDFKYFNRETGFVY